ncbi:MULTISPECIES: response regulator [Deinococcus]|uniref:CheY-like chemotaxis protein n=2 Tax=Deinococcus soli (ex Cha et al. 2016) TaxID=1309411 RepID=A0ACC6KF86_9DEIO|nr:MULTISPECIES: response regulator [Deinococcus]MDK2014501.1 response regulator [Deinococcus sp. 43]MDR6218049.1 CheY-like chemotaxis protein [Deinococcus soli (ex Cha et al. 2016)]MDR6328299.1 CheY-like chemotaxis protein [Deinococcus soli (ex Cha et al. 2016)]MDR6751151.1 CheY-like chemotaxis protein [Deinococcus soli (ex Cha et al. 2016)]GGB78833.1 response regulator [Deinococcus soli (ex Cha et al. 2016)]
MTPPTRFLLIDDNPHDQLLAIEAFAELCPDCHLSVASTGQQALAGLQAAAELPEVILLDVNMPGMDGFEVLQALKDDPRLHLIPVVMLSTSGAQDDVQAAYTLYASSYIVKAQQFTAFLEQMDGFLRYWQRVNLTVQR